MPRSAKVTVEDAVDAISFFGQYLQSGKLPTFKDKFYQNVSDKLENKWSRRDIYTNLRENRRGFLTKVFKKLEIEIDNNKENINKNANLTKTSIECLDYTESEPTDFCESEFTSFYVNNKNEEFNLCIRKELWNRMKPEKKNYKNREYLILAPGIWTDILADEYWLQYRMPCAFSFKKATVSSNPERPYIYIQGKCKSKVCNNEFHAIAKTEPCDGADLWLKIKTKDTRDTSHEPLKRQLKNEKRKLIGQHVLKDGVANTKRNIARKVLNLGDGSSPILYTNDVLRKLMQECINEELGVDPLDGNHPVLILDKLKYRAPYAGSITFVGLDPFILHYLLPEQISVLQEYCCIFKNVATLCLDSTSSLAKSLPLIDNIKTANIFLFEIVIKFFSITVSV